MKIMNIERVKTTANDPKRTRKELEQMRVNALAQRNDEAVKVIEVVLRERFPSSASSLRRDNAEDAATVMESLFPLKSERIAVLVRLLKSVAIADAIAPNAWAVSLFPRYFRLNVGQVEVYVADEAGIFLNCCALFGTPSFNSDRFSAVNYDSVPSPQCNFRGSALDLMGMAPVVEKAHVEFVKYAARAPSGKPRAGTPFGKSHSEGLLKYARQMVDAEENGT
jgi:hypothetical protein